MNTTNHEVARLRALAASGALLMDAADAMSWNFQRVLYWESRLKIRFTRGRRPTLSQKEEGQLHYLAGIGCTQSEAALRMGWQSQRVSKWALRLDIRFRRSKATTALPQEIERLRQLSAAGHSAREVAALMNWELPRVSRWAKRLGIKFKRANRTPPTWER